MKSTPHISAEHDLAMFCLPADGRWQTEAQLKGQTLLEDRTVRVYRELVCLGFAEHTTVPILCGSKPPTEVMHLFRSTWALRRKYIKAKPNLGDKRDAR